MWNETTVIPVIIRTTGTISSHSYSTWAAYRESTKSRNYIKEPYWTQHTYCGKCWCTVQCIYTVRHNITVTINCNHRTIATLETWLVSGI
jgi:hypothetical protein